MAIGSCANLQGYILGQYAMLWAMQNPDKVEKMVVLNTPLGAKSKLRPELAAYKNRMAFLRPDPKVSSCARRNSCKNQVVLWADCAASVKLHGLLVS